MKKKRDKVGNLFQNCRNDYGLTFTPKNDGNVKIGKYLNQTEKKLASYNFDCEYLDVMINKLEVRSLDCLSQSIPQDFVGASFNMYDYLSVIDLEDSKSTIDISKNDNIYFNMPIDWS